MYFVLGIIALIFTVILLHYLSQYIKRLRLHKKLKKAKLSDLRLNRRLFSSILVHDGKRDISFSFEDKRYELCLLTTFSRRVVYHFHDGVLKVKLKMVGLFTVNQKTSSNGTLAIDLGGHTAKSYNMYFVKNKGESTVFYVITLPSPIYSTGIKGNKKAELFNGDEIYKDVIISDAKHFTERVLKA